MNGVLGGQHPAQLPQTPSGQLPLVPGTSFSREKQLQQSTSLFALVFEKSKLLLMKHHSLPWTHCIQRD